MNEIKTRFPNVKVCYMASRISGRYATSTLNPEPYAYWTGWAIKKVIGDQISGDAQLIFSGAGAKSPWLSWGIYMWSDGSTPQTSNPNIFFDCPGDYQNDGTHPSTLGAQKVGGLLLNFFSTDSTCTPWFTGTGCPLGTGIANHEPEKTISIFPNPSAGKFQISGGGSYSLEVYNLFGALIYTTSSSSRNMGGGASIDLSNYPHGVYALKIKTGKEVYFRKLVLNN